MSSSVIVAHKVRKVYGGEIEAVKDLSLEVPKGIVFGFLGPNGAGKTTSIKLMTGLIRPTSGNLNVLGYELPTEAEKLASEIGYVPQDLIYYGHLTVRENLQLFAEAHELPRVKDRCDEVMALLQIEKLADRKAVQLSGGQKRRLNLAIGLLHTPSLLFLDEPSVGMDPQSRHILWKTIEEIAKKGETTIILTTHLMETADRLSDQIAIMDHGEILVIDTPTNLKRQFGTSTIIQVEFEDRVPLDQVENAWTRLSSRYQQSLVREEERLFKLKVEEETEDLATIFQFLTQSLPSFENVQVHLRPNTLEDVFLELTGSSLREND